MAATVTRPSGRRAEAISRDSSEIESITDETERVGRAATGVSATFSVGTSQA